MLVDKLSTMELFQRLPKDALDKLVPHCREATFQRDTAIFEESDEENDLYVLLKGRASIEMKLPAGSAKMARLAMAEEGQILGEMSFVSGARRSATVRAFDEVKVLIIHAEGLYEVMEEDNRIGYVVMKHLAECLRRRLDDTSLMWRNICAQHSTDREMTGILSRDRRAREERREKVLRTSFPDRRQYGKRRELPDRRSGWDRRIGSVPDSG